MLHIINSRLGNQQLVHPKFKTPVDVVRWFGAMQSQDLPASLWALGLRLDAQVTEAEVEQAIANKSLVRSWPMRGTIHLMPAEDARWMVRLLAPRLDAKATSNYRRAGLSAQIIEKAGEILRQTLRGTQCTRSELYAALNAAGISTGAQNGEQRGMHLLVHWARHGLLCIAPRRGKQQTFALFDEWITASQDLTGDQALTELARRYFRSHGPATIKDFAWWAGVTMTEARQAVLRLKLPAETVEGVQYWFNAPAAKANKVSGAFLLPPYDEYTVAYADRSAVVNPGQLRAAKYGIAPNVIIDGRIVGTWKRVIKKDTLIIKIELLASLDTLQKSLVWQAAKRYSRFLGLPVKDIEFELI